MSDDFVEDSISQHIENSPLVKHIWLEGSQWTKGKNHFPVYIDE